jgi:hypothetical protein
MLQKLKAMVKNFKWPTDEMIKAKEVELQDAKDDLEDEIKCASRSISEAWNSYTKRQKLFIALVRIPLLFPFGTFLLTSTTVFLAAKEMFDLVSNLVRLEK